MRVAIVYDRVNKWGGAERVLLALHELFPKAPLYTAVYSKKRAGWASVFPEVIPSYLQKIPFMQDKHEFLGTFTPLAFETLDLSGHDLVVSVTSEAAKGVMTKPGSTHICYCLTPTRYLWSEHDTYFENRLLWFFSRPAVFYLRKWDKMAAKRPDVMVAISRAVKKRIKKYYERDPKVIFPPVDTEKFKATGKEIKEEYYLVVSRLVKYKRVDLAIKAANALGKKLVVVGEGVQKASLKRMAEDNVHFVDELTDGELANYYRKASGLIFPQEEDFGIVAVEAQAAGTPVIAFKAGGAKDTVVDGKTGVFFNKQTPKSIIKAIGRFEKMDFDAKDLVRNAERFEKERFQKEFEKLVKDATG